MMTVREIRDTTAFAAVQAFLQATEKQAAQVAQSFDTGSEVTFGRVMQRKNGATFFNLTGTANDVAATMAVAIPRGMPEGDTWSLWVMAFEGAGLVVKHDTDYLALVYAAADEETKFVEDNAEAYLAHVLRGAKVFYSDGTPVWL